MKIDKRRKYIAVIDTETLGVDVPLVYDLGITITDKQGRIYAQANWIVKEVFENKKQMQSAYYANKLPKYHKMIEEGSAKVLTWAQIRQAFNSMMIQYGVKVISAYNLGFDKRALAYTHKALGNKTKFLTKPYELWDIWGIATQTILRQKSYHRIANQENWKTPKGNLLTNAEVCYRYITNQLNFIEEHTALHDSTIETAILARCLRQHKKLQKGILAHPWKLAQVL